MEQQCSLRGLSPVGVLSLWYVLPYTEDSPLRELLLESYMYYKITVISGLYDLQKIFTTKLGHCYKQIWQESC